MSKFKVGDRVMLKYWESVQKDNWLSPTPYVILTKVRHSSDGTILGWHWIPEKPLGGKKYENSWDRESSFDPAPIDEPVEEKYSLVVYGEVKLDNVTEKEALEYLNKKYIDGNQVPYGALYKMVRELKPTIKWE